MTSLFIFFAVLLLFLLPVDARFMKTVTCLNSMILGFSGVMVRANEILEIVCSNIRCEKDRAYQFFAENPEISSIISFFYDRMNLRKTTMSLLYVAFMTYGEETNIDVYSSYRDTLIGDFYRNFSSLKPMEKAHLCHFALLRHRKAKREVGSHNAVIRVFIVSFASWTICA